jgi:hypothetical protein
MRPTYGRPTVNYVKLDRVPEFDGDVLRAMRAQEDLVDAHN